MLCTPTPAVRFFVIFQSPRRRAKGALRNTPASTSTQVLPVALSAKGKSENGFHLGQIDRSKLRDEAAKLDGVGRRVWLNRAIDLILMDRLLELFAGYLHVHDVLQGTGTTEALLSQVQRFYEQSLAGHYYDPFESSLRPKNV